MNTWRKTAIYIYLWPTSVPGVWSRQHRHPAWSCEWTPASSTSSPPGLSCRRRGEHSPCSPTHNLSPTSVKDKDLRVPKRSGCLHFDFMSSCNLGVLALHSTQPPRFCFIPRHHKRKLLPAKVLPLPTLGTFLPTLALLATHLFLPLGQWQGPLPPQHHGMAVLHGVLSVGGQDGPEPPWPCRGAFRSPVAVGIVQYQLQDQHPAPLLGPGVHHQLVAARQPSRALGCHGKPQALWVQEFQARGRHQNQQGEEPLHCRRGTRHGGCRLLSPGKQGVCYFWKDGLGVWCHEDLT